MKKSLPLEIVAPVIFILSFIAALAFNWLEPRIEDVDELYVKEHTGKYGYVLVDVRDEDIYEGFSPREGFPGGHIPGAISFPVGDITVAAASAAMAKVGITKSNTIILYSDNDRQVEMFSNALVNRFRFSMSRIKNYRGGVADWMSYPENILLPEDHE